MISLICYFIWLCWDVETNKAMFATLSTFEFAIELSLLTIACIIWLGEKMIKIEQLLPLLKKGWVAMDNDGSWLYFRSKPIKCIKEGMWGFHKHGIGGLEVLSFCFDIAPADDWEKSLIRVKSND